MRVFKIFFRLTDRIQAGARFQRQPSSVSSCSTIYYDQILSVIKSDSKLFMIYIDYSTASLAVVCHTNSPTGVSRMLTPHQER